MPHKNYQKGARLERKIVNKARAMGFIASRSAGSKSPIDVWILDPHKRVIELIQCKSGKDAINLQGKLESELKGLNGVYSVNFKVAIDASSIRRAARSSRSRQRMPSPKEQPLQEQGSEVKSQ